MISSANQPHPVEISQHSMQLDKVYEPGRFEPKSAEWWMETGLFAASTDPDRETFALVAPTPNVRGVV